MICTVCYSKGRHRGHHIVDFEDAITQKRTEGDKILKDLTELFTALQKEISSLQDTSSKLRLERCRVDESIRDTATAYKKALEDATKVAYEAAEKLYIEKDRRLLQRFHEIEEISRAANSAIQAYSRFDPQRPQLADLESLEDFLKDGRAKVATIRKIAATPVECGAFKFEADPDFVVPRSLGVLGLAECFTREIAPPTNVRVLATEPNAVRLQWDEASAPEVKVSYVVRLKSTQGKLCFTLKTEILYVSCLRTRTEYGIRVKRVVRRGNAFMESRWSDPEVCTQTLGGEALGKTAVLKDEFRGCLLGVLEGWIQNRECELLYRGSRDNFSAEVFHAMCDGMGPTLTLFRSEGGNVFGGYTSKSWGSEEGRVEDEKAFLFTLVSRDRMRPMLFPVKKPKNAVFHARNCGPSFGNVTELRIPANMKRVSGFSGMRTYGNGSDDNVDGFVRMVLWDDEYDDVANAVNANVSNFICNFSGACTNYVEADTSCIRTKSICAQKTGADKKSLPSSTNQKVSPTEKVKLLLSEIEVYRVFQ